MNDAAIIILLLMAYGFYINRKYLYKWSKDWWFQFKIAWNGGKNGG